MTRKLFAVFQILFALALAASATLLALPHTAEAAAAWTKTGNPANQSIDFGGNTATFSSVNIGTASSDRIVVVVVAMRGSNGTSVSTVTIGGTSATQAVQSTQVNGRTASIWYANITSGTTADIVVTESGTFSIDDVGIAVGTLTGVNTTPTATNSVSYNFSGDPQTITITVPSGGFGIVVLGCDDETTQSWSSATEDYTTATAGTALTVSMAHTSTAGSQTPSADGCGFAGDTRAASAWEPAPARAVLVKPPNNLGLVGYWSFNEGTSTKATDFSGNGNTGTLSAAGGSGIPTWANGKRGSALDFDGTDSYVSVSGTTQFAVSSAPFSVSAWVRLDSFTNDTYPSIVTLRSNTTNPWTMIFSNDPLYLGVTIGSADTWALLKTDTPTSQLTGTWRHVVVTYNGSGAGTAANFKIYFDGANQTLSTADGFGSASQATEIGRYDGGCGCYWDGKIDDARIYNRALSASEVAAMYNQGTAGASQIGASSQTLQNGTTLGSGLVGLWTFDGYDLTDKVYDRSGQNNNGYFNGGATSSAKAQGKLGQALTFDGVDDYVETTNNLGITGASARTITFWTKLLDLNDQMFVSTGTDSDNQLFGVSYVGAWYINGYGGPNDCNSGQNAVAGVWYFVAVTYDGTDAHGYVNGSDLGTCTHTFATANNKVRVGARIDGIQFSTATIDDVRIYNRALTPAEVKQLYKLGITQMVQ